ncbi:DUF4393 domain-containing protein [Sporosarcina sp. FSL K6-3508]|uniref:DUF4393 domain-containing protein n=1 Tax=Sporosarcina sp. FSL K6-3508 TaxID=2921557 RepID=UPI00315A75DA
MTESNDNNVEKAVVGLVTESARPLSLSIGQSLTDIYFGLVGSRTQTYASNRMAAEMMKRDQFVKDLVTKSENIDDKDLKEPEMHIIGPAIEATKFYMDNDALKQMFEELILSSMQISKAKHVHPSFVEIIKQLSPLDAANLSFFKKSHALPIANYRLSTSKNDGSVDLQTNVFLSNPSQSDIDLQASSITNLNRVGLISLNYTSSILDQNVYNDFNKTELFLHYEKLLSLDEEAKPEILKRFVRITCTHGIAKLTPFGEDFVKIVLK